MIHSTQIMASGPGIGFRRHHGYKVYVNSDYCSPGTFSRRTTSRLHCLSMLPFTADSLIAVQLNLTACWNRTFAVKHPTAAAILLVANSFRDILQGSPSAQYRVSSLERGANRPCASVTFTHKVVHRPRTRFDIVFLA